VLSLVQFRISLFARRIMSIHIRRVERTSTRPCRFSLCLQNGSVYADFDVDGKGRVFLVRISFDGYGCCDTKEDIEVMNAVDSLVLIDAIDRSTIDSVLDSEEIGEMLCSYFLENKKVIWLDALKEHSLM